MKYRHLFILLFLYLWIFLGFYLARSESPTFDEPIHLKAGIEYKKGNYDFDPIEPPLLRRFVYYWGEKIEKITSPSPTLFPYRAVVVIITGISISLFLWPFFTQSLFVGLLGGFLFAYEPNLVAHSHYFTTDAFSAILSVAASLCIVREYWKTNKQLILFSLILALAMATKIATLSLIAPLLFIKSWRLGKRRLIFIASFCIIFIWFTYGFRWQPLGNFLDWNLPFGGYLRSLKENILFATRGHPLFFNGILYQKAPMTKTFAVIFYKTSLPLLLFAAWGIFKGKNNKHLFIILSLAIAVSLLKPLNFGIRHLLPIQIVFMLFALKVKPRYLFEWMIFSLLIGWQVISFWRVIPQPITFTNELVGHPDQVFTDSDFDWGQGLVELKDEVNHRNIKNFQLAYFGNNDPKVFLDNFDQITSVKQVDRTKPFIVSVTCYYQCGYYRDAYFSRLPKKIMAKSFFYFP